jgi:putative ABC transport system ATP-binding protein
MNEFAIRTEGLTKIYDSGHRTTALQDVCLEIPKGSLTCIMGPSGHGKSTLLHLLGGLDSPTSGKVYVDGVDLTSVDSDELAAIRCQRIGFVFQFFNLLPVLSALENVEVSLMLGGVPRKAQEEHARELLQLLGLEEKLHAKPNELSGGQRQRVAIARALANDPDILLMDEPSGNLDTASEKELLEHIQKVNREGKTIVVVSHSQAVGSIAQKRFLIKDGRVLSDV